MEKHMAGTVSLADEHVSIQSLPTYPGCYVCGQNHAKGLRIEFFTCGKETVQCSYEPDGYQTGYDGVVHGGVVSAIMDELLGWSISFKNEILAVTAELSIRFQKPVTVGKTYTAIAKVENGQGRLWKASGIIKDDDGKIYVKAEGRYFLTNENMTAEIAEKMIYGPNCSSIFRDGEKM